MLTKYKDIRPKKDVKSPLKNVFMSVAYSKIFSKVGAPNFDVFSRVVFSGKIILKHLEIKKGSRGFRGHVPPEKF